MALRAVPEHPKFASLQASLSLRKLEAMGVLELLWHFAGKYAPQGNIGRFTDFQIEAWIGWDRATGSLIAALRETGWLDVSAEHRLVVHDWHEHADTTTRKQLARKKLPFLSGHVPDTSAGNGKVPSPPAPEPEPVPEPAPAIPSKPAGLSDDNFRTLCELVYLAYPRQVGKDDALKAIGRAASKLGKGGDLPKMPLPDALEYLRKRAATFARSPAGQQGEYTPHPATWFNKGRYLDDDDEWRKDGNGATQQHRNGARGSSGRRTDAALDELAKAGVEVAPGRPEDRVTEIRAAPGGRDGRDAAGVVLEGAR